MKANNKASVLLVLNIDNVTAQESVVIFCSKNTGTPFPTELLRQSNIVIEHAVGMNTVGRGLCTDVVVVNKKLINLLITII